MILGVPCFKSFPPSSTVTLRHKVFLLLEVCWNFWFTRRDIENQPYLWFWLFRVSNDCHRQRPSHYDTKYFYYSKFVEFFGSRVVILKNQTYLWFWLFRVSNDCLRRITTLANCAWLSARLGTSPFSRRFCFAAHKQWLRLSPLQLINDNGRGLKDSLWQGGGGDSFYSNYFFN